MASCPLVSQGIRAGGDRRKTVLEPLYPGRQNNSMRQKQQPPHGLGSDGGGAYWRAHLRLIGLLLAVWFSAGLGCGVLWREFLDSARMAGTGFPLGFWFAQQGSIYVFVILIWVYVWRMDRLDRRFGVREEDEGGQG